MDDGRRAIEVSVEFVEIYKEEIRDLLAASPGGGKPASVPTGLGVGGGLAGAHQEVR